MKYLFIILPTLFNLTSCDFSTIDLEIKSVSEIPGEIDSIKTNTELNIIFFSGYNEEQAEIWTQCIAEETFSKKKIRVITPQYYRKTIKAKMLYTILDRDELEALDALHDISDKNEEMKHLLKPAKRIDFSAVIKGDYSDIKVFFNPKFREEEYQTLPIIIGKLQ